jgi:hypothetical protein
MNRRGFVLALFGAAAGLALTHREAMALPIAKPQLPEPGLTPDHGVLSEDEHAQLSAETIRLRRYRRVIRPRRRGIVRRYYVRPRRRPLRWYPPRRRVIYYY